MRWLRQSLGVAICWFIIVGLGLAQGSASGKTPAGASDAAYIAKALSAAPPGVAKGAGVARIDKDGTLQTLRASKNGLTCLAIDRHIMCAHAYSLAFFDAA